KMLNLNNNMNKRGQLTLFIIIAIIIIAAVILVIFLQRGFPGADLSEGEIAEVKSYLSECFELKVKEGIIALGRQAGYNSLENVENINFLDEQTAYYWKDGQRLVPSINTVGDELTIWLNENTNSCFLSPTLAGYEFEGECSASSEISENVNVVFDCPVTVRKGAASSRIESFDISVEAPVLKLLNVSAQVVNEYKKEPGYLCIECLDEIALANNVTLTAVPITKDIFEPEHIWFLITDKNIKFEDKNITWRFVAEL
ncbi:MAG: hypothetical protein ACTSXD_06580, partial [Candidatus Heimdallarchaeaceae archaeon]